MPFPKGNTKSQQLDVQPKRAPPDSIQSVCVHSTVVLERDNCGELPGNTTYTNVGWMMKRLACFMGLLAGLFDKMLDRAIDSAERKTQNRINQRIDQTIDKGLNKTEETMHCVATDQECFKRAKEEGKQVSVISAPSSSDSVKCVVTDTSCLKQAKTQGKKVEIVDDADLDTLRCSVSDGDCLKRAKSLGEKVEILG